MNIKISNTRAGRNCSPILRIYGSSFVFVPQDSNSQVAGGGVSVYYSHVLQMLFFSYCQGKSFAATISRTTLEVLQLFSINIKRWAMRI